MATKAVSPRLDKPAKPGRPTGLTGLFSSVRNGEKIRGTAMVLPSFMLMLLIVFYPIIEGVRLSFQDTAGRFTLENYRLLFTDSFYYTNIFYTVAVVAATVLITVAAAYGLAIYTTYGKSLLARIAGLLYIFVRFVPGIVAVFAFMSFYRDTGAVNRFLMQWGISFDPRLLYTGPGIAAVNLWFQIPFAAMIISSALSAIHPSLIESARDAGAGNREIFCRIIWPLSRKTSVLAAVFVFMAVTGSFTAPFLIGANFPKMLGVALYQEFKVFYQPEMASALAVFMFFLSSFAGGVYVYVQMKKESWQ